jgi:hypothetical protein
MTIATGLGGAGVVMFGASIVVHSVAASNCLAFAGLALMLIAAWRGSRWWLLPVAGVAAATGIMFLLMHKRY